MSQAPSAQALGFTVACRANRTFGPVLEISASGLGAKVYDDKVAALPPLTAKLARRALELVRLSRVASAEAMLSLEEALVRISRLVSDQKKLKSLVVELQVELDGTIWAGSAELEAYQEGEAGMSCVIRPNPSQYVKQIALKSGEQAEVRPIKPEDEKRIVDFHNDLSEKTVYLRYLQFLKFEERISHDRLARVCFNDYSRELALLVEKDDKILGVGRLQRNPLRMEEAEMAFLVRDSAQGQGIGSALVAQIVGAARMEGITRLTAEMLADNRVMRGMLEKVGFRVRMAADGQTLLKTLAMKDGN